MVGLAAALVILVLGGIVVGFIGLGWVAIAMMLRSAAKR